MTPRAECQFSDRPGLVHRPFSERSPICWDCFIGAIDVDARWEAIARQLGAALELSDPAHMGEKREQWLAARSVYRDAIKETP